jgi:hypothetical protein
MGITAKKLSWAWKMKQIAHELYGWAGVEPPEHYETKEGEQDRDIKLTKLASTLFPEGPTVVEVWVAIGTPAFRESVYPRTWIDYILKQGQGNDVLVIPDCRFPNEIEALKDEGGWCYRCVREGFPGRDTVADRALRGKEVWDGTIGGPNVGCLVRQAHLMAEALHRGRSPTEACINSNYWSYIYYNNLREANLAY